MPSVMNAANEEAANSFLRGEVGFLEIYEIVEGAMQNHVPRPADLASVLETDAQTRQFVRNYIKTA